MWLPTATPMYNMPTIGQQQWIAQQQAQWQSQIQRQFPNVNAPNQINERHC
jgi:hypothetical protein